MNHGQNHNPPFYEIPQASAPPRGRPIGGLVRTDVRFEIDRCEIQKAILTMGDDITATVQEAVKKAIKDLENGEGLSEYIHIQTQSILRKMIKDSIADSVRGAWHTSGIEHTIKFRAIEAIKKENDLLREGE